MRAAALGRYRSGVTAAEFFAALPGRFDPSAAVGVAAIIQFELSGDGGGTWHATIADGACEVGDGAALRADAGRRRLGRELAEGRRRQPRSAARVPDRPAQGAWRHGARHAPASALPVRLADGATVRARRRRPRRCCSLRARRPGPPDRALHPRTGDPRFLVVTQPGAGAARGRLGVGPVDHDRRRPHVARGAPGRAWRHSRSASPTARVYVSRGQHYEIRDPSLAQPGRVRASLAVPGHRHGAWRPIRGTTGCGRSRASATTARRCATRTTAAASGGSVSASGLCVHPRSLAASSEPGRDGRVRLFAACREGLFASDDLGYSFRRLTSAPSNVRDVATSAFDAGTVVIASPIVRVSRDRGETFSSKGLSARLVAVDPRNPSLIFAIALNGRLYASADGGDHVLSARALRRTRRSSEAQRDSQSTATSTSSCSRVAIARLEPAVARRAARAARRRTRGARPRRRRRTRRRRRPRAAAPPRTRAA